MPHTESPFEQDIDVAVAEEVEDWARMDGALVRARKTGWRNFMVTS